MTSSLNGCPNRINCLFGMKQGVDHTSELKGHALSRTSLEGEKHI